MPPSGATSSVSVAIWPSTASRQCRYCSGLVLKTGVMSVSPV